MKISEVLNRAALAYVRATADAEATEITGFEENSYANQGCPTCGPDVVIEVVISFRSPSRQWGDATTFNGTFTEFIRTLDEYDSQEGT